MKISEAIELLEEIQDEKGNLEIGIWQDGFESIDKAYICITDILCADSRIYKKTLVIGKMATEDDEESLYDVEED